MLLRPSPSSPCRYSIICCNMTINPGHQIVVDDLEIHKTILISQVHATIVHSDDSNEAFILSHWRHKYAMQNFALLVCYNCLGIYVAIIILMVSPFARNARFVHY